MTSDDSASDKFTDTRKDEVGDISDIDSVKSCCAGDRVINRKKESSPAKRSEPESKCSGSHREYDELPSAASDSLNEVIPLHFTE